MRDSNGMGARLKEVRQALGYTQKGIAEAVGSKLRSWQDYEAGKKTPGSQVIVGLVRLRINANWLIDGTGPMFLDETQVEPQELMVRDVLEGDEEARKYRENQAVSVGSAIRAADQVLQDVEAGLGYTPPLEVKTTIQELLIGGHLTARGAAILLQRLRTTLKQEDSE